MGCGSSKNTTTSSIVNATTHIPDRHIKVCNTADEETTKKTSNTERQLTPYSDACQAFPRPNTTNVTCKYDLHHFFTPEHKAIYPGFDTVNRLDQYVEKAPESLKRNIKGLVDYLMKPTSGDYDKARVIIRWVATNIKYDVNYLATGQRGSSDPQDVLNECTGVCAGYSNLVFAMCRLCDLPCEKISGIVKKYKIGDDVNGRKRISRHMWNRVKISNTWFLCDATWASGFVEKVNGIYTYVFRWNEGYFLTPPETFRYSHKPDDSALAMVEDPVSDVDEWMNQVRVYPSAYFYKVSCVKPSLAEGCIKTDSNRIELIFHSKYKMTYEHNLKCEATNQTVKNSTALLENENTATLLLRLPHAGVYKIILLGEPVCLSDRAKKDGLDKLMAFIVHATGVTGSQLFPDFTYFLGSVSGFIDGGFKSSVTYPIIETVNGYTRFTIERPECEPITFSFRNDNGNDLTEYVFADSYPEKVIFNVRCPTIGEYSLKLRARLSKEHVSMNRYETGARYLIQNKNATPLLPYLPFQQWGPNDRFDTYKIILDTTKGSEIVCTNKESKFEIQYNEKNTQILYSLKTKDNEKVQKWVYAETHRQGSTVNIQFRFRVVVIGFYEFKLFARKPDTTTKDSIGRWLVNVIKPYEGNVFAFSKNKAWGPCTFKMIAHNLQVKSPISSTIYQKDEEPGLVIASTIKRRTGITFKFKNGSGTDLNDCVVADSVQQNDDTILYTFKFYPPTCGFYCLDVFSQPSGTCIGSWLVDAKKKQSLQLPSNKSRPWGPVQTLFDYGFSVIQPKSAVISSPLGKDTILTLTSGTRGKILGRLNFHKQTEDLKDEFNVSYSTEDIHRNKIVITFKLASTGYYKFRLFIRNKEEGEFNYGGAWLVHCI